MLSLLKESCTKKRSAAAVFAFISSSSSMYVCMHIILLYYAGITDTAIGGQRIEEYMLNDTSLLACSDRTGVKNPEWNGRLYGKQTLPFVDMTVKGWLWYQVSE
jgi:hypothetical protein